MKRFVVTGVALLVVLSSSTGGWAATGNTGNNPCFLWLDICSNAFQGRDGITVNPLFGPETIDIGVDLGADGSVDVWLSKSRGQYLADWPQSSIAPGNWRRFVLPLDEYAGQTVKLRIVDKSDKYFIAANSIRLNYADGSVVKNGVPNGSFEDATPLANWKIVEGTIQNAADLLGKDTNGNYLSYEKQFLTTKVSGNADKVTVESDAFVLTPISSFIYGLVSAGGSGGSSYWDNPGAFGSDNGAGVYVDIGTATADPNGKYDAGVDIPLTGMIRDGDYAYSVLFNTSGLEGKRAQIVVADQSVTDSVSVDGWRMNWDPDYITNGGFEDIPADWTTDDVLLAIDHPSGGVPGWTINRLKKIDGTDGDADADIFFFSKNFGGSQRADRAWVGTDGGDQLSFGVASAGIELRSKVFTIQSIPPANQNVFLQFASAEASTRIQPNDEHSTIELQVDVDGNGKFGDAADYTYRQRSQGFSWNRQMFDEVDEWHYPEYRFYIAPEHQGKTARIFIEELFGGGYGWMAVDDFFVWNGKNAALAFPNSDLEMGNLTNWTEEIDTPDNLSTWLSGSEKAYNEGKTLHRTLNNLYSTIDGDFSLDSADNENGGGDSGKGRIYSNPFTLPTKSTLVIPWSLME